MRNVTRLRYLEYTLGIESPIAVVKSKRRRPIFAR